MRLTNKLGYGGFSRAVLVFWASPEPTGVLDTGHDHSQNALLELSALRLRSGATENASPVYEERWSRCGRSGSGGARAPAGWHGPRETSERGQAMKGPRRPWTRGCPSHPRTGQKGERSGAPVNRQASSGTCGGAASNAGEV